MSAEDRRCGQGRAASDATHRAWTVLLALAVMVAVTIVGSRAWALGTKEWLPVPTTSLEAGVLRTDVSRFDVTSWSGAGGDHCDAPETVPTRGWWPGPRLVLDLGRGTARLPGGRHHLALALQGAAEAFGAAAGPCGRGPIDRWIASGTMTGVRGGFLAAPGHSVRCAAGDGVSVVELGPLPGAPVGMACIWAALDSDGVARVVEADIRLDERERWSTDADHCTGAFDVQSVLTHEIGHVAGLEHPDDGTHAATMARTMSPCDTSPRTLSGPDLEALLRHFGH